MFVDKDKLKPVSLGKTEVLQEVAPTELAAFKLHADQAAESRQITVPPATPTALPSLGGTALCLSVCLSV